eukprot:TRINITY_DN57270_c0_g1_i1.p1 TRINITY_DN57270_c0_g1~~TRINITY_DN57270_c0_g1_i1.p1  ORF type:complete len:322 (+),score=55.97 TRINITY_DN57270_c0_g1_i1:69-1034(+)
MRAASPLLAATPPVARSPSPQDDVREVIVHRTTSRGRDSIAYQGRVSKQGVCLAPHIYMPSHPAVASATSHMQAKGLAQTAHVPLNRRRGAITASRFEEAGGACKTVHTGPSFGDAPAANEACKFSPEEQERLLELRKRLVSSVLVFEDLRSTLLMEENGAASGLPLIAEAHRTRLNGKNFCAEDAVRHFGGTWLTDAMGRYVGFIDGALRGELDAERSSSRPPGSPRRESGQCLAFPRCPHPAVPVETPRSISARLRSRVPSDPRERSAAPAASPRSPKASPTPRKTVKGLKTLISQQELVEMEVHEPRAKRESTASSLP